MKVADLIARLQRIDPETVVVKFNRGPAGYDDVHFLDGTHTGEDRLKANRARFVKGEARPDWLVVDSRTRSRARTVAFLVLY